MKRYIAKRILSFIPTLFLTIFIIFIAMSSIQKDTARLYLGENADKESIQEFNRQENLDKPIFIRFVLYLKNFLMADVGKSLENQQNVSSLFFSRFKNTFILASLSILLTTILAIPLGVVCAVNRGSIKDKIASFVSLLGLSLPSFWLSLLLILAFSYKLKIFPSSGYGSIKHLVLPVISLSLSLVCLVSRSLRNSILEEKTKTFYLFLQSKGLSNNRIVWFHLLRASMISIITSLGQQASYVLTGSVLIETIFNFPGIGLLIYRAILLRDTKLVTYSIVMCCLMMSFINLIVDILYIVFDPEFKKNLL